MKLRNKLVKALILASVILLVTIGLVIAQPRPIGTTLQPNPFDSNPAAPTAVNTTLNYASSMRDGRLSTNGYFTICEEELDPPYDAQPGYVEFTTFDKQAFTIGWVEIKIKYSVGDYFYDDSYNIKYTTDDSTWITLVPDSSSGFDPATASAQVCSWSQVSPSDDGTWDWNDIGNLTIRISFDPGTDLLCEWIDMYVYEVWLTIYEGPPPPSSSAGLSIQPRNVSTLAAGRRFFVEFYAQNVTALQLYQITVLFNTTVLNPLSGGWGYYPFTAKYVEELNDVKGYVSLTYGIDGDDPLVNTGVSGNFSLYRLYFQVDSAATTADYSWLAFNVSLLSAPGAVRITHKEYHGLYGTPPAGTHLMSWIPASKFPYDAPISTWWHEQYPDFCHEYHLTSWDDQGDLVLGYCDTIDMDDCEYIWWFHVEEVWESFVDAPDPGQNFVYMIVTFQFKEPKPEFPLGIGIMMTMALAIPVVYVWRKRKKVEG